MNPRLSVAEHRRMLEGTGTSWLLHQRELAEAAGELAAGVKGLRTVGLGGPGAAGGIDLLARADGASPADPHVPLRESDPTLLLHTSGTTGVLKAATHTQGSYAAITTNILANLLSPGPDSVMLHAASLIHASGTFVLPYWIRGATSVVLPGFDPRRFLEAIPRHRVTEVNLVPTMLGMLFAGDGIEDADLSSLRTVVYRASPMPRPLLERAVSRLGPIVKQYHGQTEVPWPSRCSTRRITSTPLTGSCGRPSVDMDVRLADEHGRPVGRGEIGEVQVKSEGRTHGHAGGAEASRALPAGRLQGAQAHRVHPGTAEVAGRQDPAQSAAGTLVEGGADVTNTEAKYESIRVETVDRVTTVILDRPERRNAVDGPMAAELADAFRAFDEDTDADVAVLWGDGGHFCAGADLKAVGTERGNTVAVSGDGPMGPTRLRLAKPVIAAVEGYAVAGGLELAIWCDLRVAATDATFGVFCRRWGVPLIDGGTLRLPRLIGMSRAMDMILTGRAVDAQEAASFGLANRVVGPGTARAEAEALARQISGSPQTCLRNDRSSVYEQSGLSEADALRFEIGVGLTSLRVDGISGSARFSNGAGRHGSSAD